MGEGYVRVWVKGGDDLADEVLARWDQAWFDDHGASVDYIGSARLGHEGSVPGQDRCHILIGLRGEDDAISAAAALLDEEPERQRTEVVLVEELIVNRPASAEIFPLLPGE